MKIKNAMICHGCRNIIEIRVVINLKKKKKLRSLSFTKVADIRFYVLFPNYSNNYHRYKL